jgi:hypothetical protein
MPSVFKLGVALCQVLMLNVITPSVIMLNVITLKAVAFCVSALAYLSTSLVTQVL